MFDFSLPLWGDILVFLGSAAAIGLAGVKAARYADRLADRTGMGEAVTGMVFLGMLTALPGLMASIFAALKGHADLALSNAMGGIAVQTAALGVADLFYRKANLEHAAASAPNMMQTILLVLLMTLVISGISGPGYSVGHIDVMTLILFVAAGLGFWLVLRTRDDPMWEPTQTDQTVEDVPEEDAQEDSLRKLIFALLISASITAVAGATVAEAAENLVDETTIPVAVIGGLFMAVATSLPELVTSVAAVRRGAVTLAVSDVVGGNFFDVLFVAAADLAYLKGSLYHAQGVGHREIFLTALTILLNVVLLTGLIDRQKHGPGNIGFESSLMLLLYIIGFLVLSLAM